MNTTKSGRFAEDIAADYLKQNGYKIIDKNWRTRWCEVDIVASKDKTMCFAEVKYRNNTAWGDGLDAITGKKLKQMAFAADMWVQANDWPGDYVLLAIALEGEPPVVVDCFEIN